MASVRGASVIPPHPVVTCITAGELDAGGTVDVKQVETTGKER